MRKSAPVALAIPAAAFKHRVDDVFWAFVLLDSVASSERERSVRGGTRRVLSSEERHALDNDWWSKDRSGQSDGKPTGSSVREGISPACDKAGARRWNELLLIGAKPLVSALR